MGKLYCCRSTGIEGPPTGPLGPTDPPTSVTVPPLRAAVAVDKLQVCGEGHCRNGGTCRQVQPADSAVPSCDCPLHFTGRFCEKGRPLGFYSTVMRVPSSTSHSNCFWQLLLFGLSLGIWRRLNSENIRPGRI